MTYDERTDGAPSWVTATPNASVAPEFPPSTYEGRTAKEWSEMYQDVVDERLRSGGSCLCTWGEMGEIAAVSPRCRTHAKAVPSSGDPRDEVIRLLRGWLYACDMPDCEAKATHREPAGMWICDEHCTETSEAMHRAPFVRALAKVAPFTSDTGRKEKP